MKSLQLLKKVPTIEKAICTTEYEITLSDIKPDKDVSPFLNGQDVFFIRRANTYRQSCKGCHHNMNTNAAFKITLFHCINTFADGDALPVKAGERVKIESIKLPCSSMVKDVFLLRAFEAGADAVIAMVCPEGVCRYVEGNLRAKKRVAWVKKLLDEIGIDGRRLLLANIPAGDDFAAVRVIEDTLSTLADIGPSPAK